MEMRSLIYPLENKNETRLLCSRERFCIDLITHRTRPRDRDSQVKMPEVSDGEISGLRRYICERICRSDRVPVGTIQASLERSGTARSAGDLCGSELYDYDFFIAVHSGRYCQVFCRRIGHRVLNVAVLGTKIGNL